MRIDEFIRAVEAEGPPPCDGCRYAHICKTQQLACGKFMGYVGIAADHRRYKITRPDSGTFRDVFLNDKDDQIVMEGYNGTTQSDIGCTVMDTG
jgi:hypothetical protein